jgi:hypothetical protein
LKKNYVFATTLVSAGLGLCLSYLPFHYASQNKSAGNGSLLEGSNTSSPVESTLDQKLLDFGWASWQVDRYENKIGEITPEDVTSYQKLLKSGYVHDPFDYTRWRDGLNGSHDEVEHISALVKEGVANWDIHKLYSGGHNLDEKTVQSFTGWKNLGLSSFYFSDWLDKGGEVENFPWIKGVKKWLFDITSLFPWH